MKTVDYAITDPYDVLYDHDQPHPKIDAYFEWTIRNLPVWKQHVYRRWRRERQELRSRQHAEVRRIVHEAHGNWPECTRTCICQS